MSNLEELIIEYGLTVKYFPGEKVKHIVALTKEQISEYKEKGLYLGCDVYKSGLVVHHIKMEKPIPGRWGVKTCSWPKWGKGDYFAATLNKALDKAIKGIEKKNNEELILRREGTNKID